MRDYIDILELNRIGWDGEEFVAVGEFKDNQLWRDLHWSWNKRKRCWTTRSVLSVFPFPEERLTCAAKNHWVNLGKKGREWRAKYSDANTFSGSFSVPHGIKARQYQNAGTAGLLATPHVLLADDCGLGKTIQTIMFINERRDDSRFLVVCPPHLVLNWGKEWEKFGTRADLPFIDCTEAVRKANYKSESRFEPLPSGPGVYVVPYSSIWRDNMKWLDKIKFPVVILDEAQAIKTPAATKKKGKMVGSRRTAGAVKFLKKAERRVLLTATPVLNRPSELFHLVKHLGWPDSYKQFTERYCDGKQTAFGWDAKGATNLAELNARLRSGTMIRRKIGDVIRELPHVTRDLVVLGRDGYTSEIKAEWDALKKARKTKDIATDEVVAALEAAEGGGGADLATARREMAEAKAGDVVAFVAPMVTPDEPMVIFGHHRGALDLIKEGLKKEGLRVATITGGVNKDQKDAAVEAFQAGELDVLVCNAAGETGLTLTRARYLVHAEQDWVPGAMEQREGRVIRIGAERPIFIYTIVVDGSVDCIVAKTLVKKEKHINAVMA